MLAATHVHLRTGYERFGPPLPGHGPITGVFFYENGLAVVRHTGGQPDTATYVLMDDATEWERLYVH